MGPIIILDKSTLQSLSINEIVILNKYYLLNIVPVLTIEILGDLKKPSKRSISEEKVTILANKLLPFDSGVNVHYLDSITASLLGHVVKMDRRPLLGGGRSVRTKKGEKGIIFEETPEEKAMLRWRNGDFTSAEKILAERWRGSTRGVDLENFREHLRDVYTAIPKFSGLKELKRFLDNLIKQPTYQSNLLTLLISEFNLDFDIASKIFHRWESEGQKDLQRFAPYAFYCFSVALFFQFGLMNNLIGTRATNRVDLEYIYYFPFCMVFGSNDKFHRLLAPFFLMPNQSYVSGQELKKDLSVISGKWKNLDKKGRSEWRHKYGPAPPENSDSLSSMLWKKYMSSKKSQGDIASDLSKEQSEKLAAFIKNKIDEEIGSPGFGDNFNSDDADFIVRKSKIRINDFCPCGSGEMFKDCHGKNMA